MVFDAPRKSLIKFFPGARAGELIYYTIPTIDKFKPETVIVHVGTNDIKRKDGGENCIRYIAEGIINIARTFRAKGVKNAMVWNIICRKN